MYTIAAILGISGLLIFPAGFIYALIRRRRPNSKFRDNLYFLRYRNVLRMVSVVMCLIGVLLLLIS